MHKNAIDLSGCRFGMLLVLHENGRTADRKVQWLCRCDCGVEKNFRSHHLIAGRSASCGCERQRKAIAALTKHGKSESKLYWIWQGMKNRCFDEKNSRYHRYGGRGITVCERWLDFSNFLSDMGEPPPGLTLDRINNDGNYEPGNCRWATRKEQANNRSPYSSCPRGVNGRFVRKAEAILSEFDE